MLVGPGPPMPAVAPTLVEGARVEAVRRVSLLRLGKFLDTLDTRANPGVARPVVPGASLP